MEYYWENVAEKKTNSCEILMDWKNIINIDLNIIRFDREKIAQFCSKITTYDCNAAR